MKKIHQSKALLLINYWKMFQYNQDATFMDFVNGINDHFKPEVVEQSYVYKMLHTSLANLHTPADTHNHMSKYHQKLWEQVVTILWMHWTEKIKGTLGCAPNNKERQAFDEECKPFKETTHCVMVMDVLCSESTDFVQDWQDPIPITHTQPRKIVSFMNLKKPQEQVIWGKFGPHWDSKPTSTPSSASGGRYLHAPAGACDSNKTHEDCQPHNWNDQSNCPLHNERSCSDNRRHPRDCHGDDREQRHDHRQEKNPASSLSSSSSSTAPGPMHYCKFCCVKRQHTEDKCMWNPKHTSFDRRVYDKYLEKLKRKGNKNCMSFIETVYPIIQGKDEPGRGKQFMITHSLNFKDKLIPTRIWLDPGASCTLMNEEFASKYWLEERSAGRGYSLLGFGGDTQQYKEGKIVDCVIEFKNLNKYSFTFGSLLSPSPILGNCDILLGSDVIGPYICVNFTDEGPQFSIPKWLQEKYKLSPDGSDKFEYPPEKSLPHKSPTQDAHITEAESPSTCKQLQSEVWSSPDSPVVPAKTGNGKKHRHAKGLEVKSAAPGDQPVEPPKVAKSAVGKLDGKSSPSTVPAKIVVTGQTLFGPPTKNSMVPEKAVDEVSKGNNKSCASAKKHHRIAK